MMLMFPRNIVNACMQSIQYSAYGRCRIDPEATCPTERWMYVCAVFVLGCLQCGAWRLRLWLPPKPKRDIIGTEKNFQ